VPLSVVFNSPMPPTIYAVSLVSTTRMAAVVAPLILPTGYTSMGRAADALEGAHKG
jgi:hypothetical protein